MNCDPPAGRDPQFEKRCHTQLDSYAYFRNIKFK